MQEFFNNIIEIFNANPVAQSVGFIAFFVQIFGILNKDDSKFIYIYNFTLFFWSLHFWLMGLYIASIIAIINIGRGVVALKYPKNIKFFVIFLIIYLINGIYNYQDASSFLAMGAALIVLYCFFFLKGKGIIFRQTLFIAGMLWLSYNVVNQSIGGVMTELIMSTLNMITILRLYRDKRKQKTEIELSSELIKMNKK